MRLSILVCLGSFICLVWFLRRERVSFGLPIAYLGNLLIIHVPGAFAHAVGAPGVFTENDLTRAGIIFTAIGTVSFVAGVVLSHMGAKPPVAKPALRGLFWKFCVLGGGVCTILGYAIRIPSIGAVVERGGPIWMLALLLALRSAFSRGDTRMALRWLAVLAIYPTLVLLLSGFMSYGAAATIIVVSGLAVTTRKAWKVAAVTILLVVGGTSVFLGYFQGRNGIRAAVWGHQDSDARIDASMGAIRGISVFNPKNPAHLKAFDERLNQNFFAGLAAARIAHGDVNYLHGQSLVEGVEALIPRALWPDKPVKAGSGRIVAQMTGLQLDENTSFGVGNVMEFQINFGIPGLLIGFLVLGFALGKLDRLAATADAVGDLGKTFLFFLPGVAMIQPNGSIVEIMGGAAAALAAALAWRWVWQRWPKPGVKRVSRMAAPMPYAP
jgi:hypothetical protein